MGLGKDGAHKRPDRLARALGHTRHEVRRRRSPQRCHIAPLSAVPMACFSPSCASENHEAHAVPGLAIVIALRDVSFRQKELTEPYTMALTCSGHHKTCAKARDRQGSPGAHNTVQSVVCGLQRTTSQAWTGAAQRTVAGGTWDRLASYTDVTAQVQKGYAWSLVSPRSDVGQPPGARRAAEFLRILRETRPCACWPQRPPLATDVQPA